MDFYSFVSGPLLRIAIITFVIGTLMRVALFFYLSFRLDRIVFRHFSLKYALASIGRWLLPLNKDVMKNPVFTASAYIFHICLIVVPVWFSGHIDLWMESRFEWYWEPIPDRIVDWMTLIFLVIALYFFLRRIISANIRLLSSFADYALLIVTTLPFLTGYMLAHDMVWGVGFLKDNIELIHILSGELMLILIPFTRLSHFALFFFSRAATGIEFGRRGYTV